MGKSYSERRRKGYKRIIHGKRWHALRTSYIREHPFCEECLKNGILDQPAEEVHHVTPIGTGKDFADMCRLAYDPQNLRSLCHGCHVLAHRRLDGCRSSTRREVSPEVRAWLRHYF